MGGKAGFFPLRVGGAADGWVVHFGVVAAAPGAMFAGGRVRTFSSEQVDMAGGLCKVNGQLCASSAFGSKLVVFRFNLAA